MSQNTFGAPIPDAEPEITETLGEQSRKGVLIGGVAGLVALVVAGGAFLVLSGDDEVEAALVAPPEVPVAASTTTKTTEPPAPLPTLAEFNGRNPFKAKIVPAGAAVGGAPAPEGAPTTAPDPDLVGGKGSTVGDDSGEVNTDFSGISGETGGDIVFVPGPTVTRTVEVEVPGPVETQVETVEVPVPGPTVYLAPGEIEVVFLGTEAERPDAEGGEPVPSDPELADFTVNGVYVYDVPVHDDENEGTFAYYFRLLGVGEEQVLLQFGDATRTVVLDEPALF